MKIVAMIPARGGSKGIPKKNIVDFCGIPLVAHSINQAKNSAYISDVYVSSDCDEILKVSKDYAAIPVKRPDALSYDESPSESAIEHFLSTNVQCDILVVLQATSPLRETKDIDSAIKKYLHEGCDSMFSAVNGRDFFVWKKEGENYTSLTYNYNNRKRRQDIASLFVENGSFYIMDASGFLKNNNRLFGKIECYVMDDWKIHEIDTLDDLELCRYLYKTKVKKWED